MKLDLTKPVQTRDGRSVKILSAEARGKQPIAGYVEADSTLEFWSESGEYYESPRVACGTDLISIPEKRTVEFWVNVYEDGAWSTHRTKECCNDYIGGRFLRTACLHIVKEFNVGEGL